MTDAERDEYIRYINDHYKLLMNKISYEIIEDEFIAEDIRQQVLIRLTPKTEILQTLHPKQVAAYIATTTKKITLDEYKKIKKDEQKKEKLTEYYQNNGYINYVDFKAFAGKYGFSEEMWHLMSRLSPLEQDILVYTYHYELSTKEVAKLIDSNMEAVKKRLQRIRRKLIYMIEKEVGKDDK